MRITQTRVCLAGLVSAVGLAFVPLNAAEESRTDEQLLTVVYPVADLAVWSVGREPVRSISEKKDEAPTFDPSLLIKLIQSTVDPESWQDGKGMIVTHERTASLIVRQTRSNLNRVSDLLSELRPKVKEEAEERLDLEGSDMNDSATSDESNQSQSSIKGLQREVMIVDLDSDAGVLFQTTEPFDKSIWEVPEQSEFSGFRSAGVVFTR